MPGNSTLLLDRTTWDLVLTASGDIAVAAEPYALAQDAASAIKTFQSECYWDTSIGVPYLTRIFSGIPPSISTLKQLFVAAAMTVPGVASATVFIASASGRGVSGQVQVTPKSGGPAQAANFSVINPQGTG
jgi:Na+-transporting NADH:ubiquinone oxidoreductase subunit NqrA